MSKLKFLIEDLRTVLGERGFDPGTIRTWKDGKFQKQKNGEWVFVGGGAGGGSGSPGGSAPATPDVAKKGVQRLSDLEKTSKTIDDLKATIAAGKLADGKSLSGHLKAGKQIISKHAATFQKSLGDLKKLAPAGATVIGRVKTLESALGKLVRKPGIYKSVNDLQDCTGMRITCKNVDDVKSAVAEIKKKYKIVSEDDYITKPQGDYRSFHLTIEGEDGLPKEVQVRTANQNTFADWAHNVYKPLNAGQAEAVEKAADVISKYSNGMANHFWDVDTGKKPPVERPSCPEVVKLHFGCL